MPIRVGKMLVDYDYGQTHGRLEMERNDLVDLPDIVNTSPQPDKLVEAREVKSPLLDASGGTTIVRENGPQSYIS